MKVALYTSLEFLNLFFGETIPFKLLGLRLKLEGRHFLKITYKIDVLWVKEAKAYRMVSIKGSWGFGQIVCSYLLDFRINFWVNLPFLDSQQLFLVNASLRWFCQVSFILSSPHTLHLFHPASFSGRLICDFHA